MIIFKTSEKIFVIYLPLAPACNVSFEEYGPILPHFFTSPLSWCNQHTGKISDQKVSSFSRFLADRHTYIHTDMTRLIFQSSFLKGQIVLGLFRDDWNNHGRSKFMFLKVVSSIYFMILSLLLINKVLNM
jgi:hypothetical protein